MNIRNAFDNSDETTIERITTEYPLLDADEKERLYAMSKEKYNSDIKNNKNNGTEVSGVERYRKPLWHKVLSAVAAAVVVVGGVGGGVLLLGKGGGVDPISDIEVSQPEYDYTAIATELTDKLLEMENTICYGDISYDEYDRTVIDIVCSDDSAQFEPPCEAILYKVTDPRFTCRRDLYDELRSVFTKQYYDENDFSTATIFGFDLNFYLGSELSDYIVDGSMDIAENLDNDDESICYAVYCDINGELYVRQCDFELSEYTSDVIIKETGENSFTATRSYRGDFVIGDGTSNRCFDFVLENGEWKIDKVYLASEESEDVTESKDEYDYTAIAQQLFDDYLEGGRIVCYGDVSYDENDSITFYTYNSNDAEWSEKYGGERTFYKVTDERFNNGQDIYEMMKTITTTNNAIRFDNNTSLIGRLVSDVSMFEIGSDVDLNDVDAERQVAAYGINLDVYIEYNGKLYVRPRPYEIEYTTEVKVIETSENGFTASRYMKMPYHNANIQYGEEVILEIVQENGEWKINYMESGIDVEYNASIAIQVYFEDDPDFYDLSIDPSDIIKNMEVLEYDDEIKRCKVHTIMIDVNGEEAVDFTGEIMLTKQFDEAIADAQVTRLNEYDGTLKRPSVLWAEQQGTLEN